MRERFAAALRTGAGKLALLSLLALHTPATAYTFKPVPSPNLDLSSLGRVAFTGDFDAISLYQYQGQTQQYPGRNGALLYRYPTGVFATINVTDADIKASCITQYKGEAHIIFAGNFTAVGTLKTPGGMALLNPRNGSIDPFPGLTGSVNTLLCNAGEVYVGGFLTGSNSSNAIVWKENGWQDLSFEGFNGPVHSIVKAANGNIIFGGEFSGLGGNVSLAAENSTQLIPIGNASISAQTSSGKPGLTDPAKIACKTDYTKQGPDSTWLLSDRSPGFWKAVFNYGFEPTALRMYNTNLDGRGTKTFRFTALPLGGIMNLSYVDPNGQKQYCDATCPLPQGNTSAQVFSFVNVVGMNAFQIDISGWYGAGAGLNGIQLTQDAILSYAINDFNEPKNCGSTTTGSQATTTGSWVVTPSHGSNSQYLTSSLQGHPIDPQAATATFYPDIKQSGNYSVLIYTPGCLDDGTCGTRGRVDVIANTGNVSQTTTLWQTNTYEKYDEVYNGFINTDSRPSIVVRAAPGQGPMPLTLVAQRVRFNLLKATSGNVNGIFEYSPGSNLVNVDLKASVINQAGASLTPKEKARVTSLSLMKNNLYVGGDFTTNDGRNNIFVIDNGATGPSALPGNGLNNQVMTLYALNDSALYVGGNFTNTKNNDSPGLNGVASLVNGKWQPLGAGVDGVVLYIVPFSLNVTENNPESVLAISGFFSKVYAFGNNTATGVVDFAVWVPSRNNWLHNLAYFSLAMSGRLTTFSDAGPDRWFGGSVSSGALLASGSLEMIENRNNLGLEAFPVDIQAQQRVATSSSSRKRAILPGQNMNTTGVQTGIFYKGNGLNKVILAGHFAAAGTDGENITNVAIIDGNDGDKVTGFGSELSANSTFAAVAVTGTTLYAGGVVNGQVDIARIGGIVAYDLAGKKFASVQPPALQGTRVVVNAIAPRPSSKDIYVGGVFTNAGTLACSAICIWNTDRNQWNNVGSNFNGNVSSLTWITASKLLIAGNLTAGTNTTTLMTFDPTNSQFTEVPDADKLPGPLTALTIATGTGDEYWAAGRANDQSAYLERFDGKNWAKINEAVFDPDTDIRSIQVVSLFEDHAHSNVIDDNQGLLLMGRINIAGFGGASAALFNGKQLVPLLLATKAQDGSTEPGSLSSIFVEHPEGWFKTDKKHLAVWAIVLIGLALALVLTFLLVVAGILIEWYRQRSQGYAPAPTVYPLRSGTMSQFPPDQVFKDLSDPPVPAIRQWG